MATSSDDGADYLTLHVGRSGCAFGSKFWELTCREHDLNLAKGKGVNLFRNFQKLFRQNDYGFYRARALFIDPDGQDISLLKQSPIKGITDPDFNFETGKQDASGNFAAGFYVNCEEMIDNCTPKILQMVESCDKTPCILSTVSYSGGCSGVYSRISELLNTEFNKATHINFGLIPSPTLGKSIIDTYNFILSQSFHYCNPSTLRVVFDNEALYASSSRHNNSVDFGFENVNIEVGRVMSLITSANRLNASKELVDLTKMIMKPRLNYLIPSYTRLPGDDSEVIEFEKAFPLARGGEGVLASCPYKEVLADVFYTKGRTPSLLIQQQLDEAKLERNGSGFENVFIDPRSIPIGMSAFDRFEMGGLTNNTGMRYILIREANKFDSIFRKRAYVHWYVGYGMEEGEFSEAREDLNVLINEYPHEGGDFTCKLADSDDDDAQAEVEEF